MSALPSKPRRWAILIGVNYYGKAVQGLRGCVADVNSIENYFLGAGVAVEHIKSFTASGRADGEAGLPIEEPSAWPTYENVTACLRAVTQKASPGDFVYIHFSGHGTQPKGNDLGIVHPETGDLALVLFDPATGIRYLHGLVLAALLKEMVDSSLLVTLVLDCCFAGSVVRHSTAGSTARYVDYNPAIDAAYPVNQAQGAYNFGEDRSMRNAREVQRLLVGSDRYSILCACGPHEIAEELCLPSWENRFSGALSHFLLRALKSLRGTNITTQTLYHHLRLKFHVYWPQQTPMWFGRPKLFFLDDVSKVDGAVFTTILRKPEDGCLYLDAGLAHGICKGDEYAVYPLTISDGAQPSFYGHAENVDQLQSRLVATTSMPISAQKETRWKAKRMSLPSWKVPVRIPIGGHEDQWGQFGEGERPFLQLISRPMKILNGSHNAIVSLPTIPSDKPRATENVLDILEHLATFKYIEGIENQNPQYSFEQSFTIDLKDRCGNNIESDGLTTVKHGETVTITVENFGSNPLYLTILDMGSLWQIDDVLSAEGVADFKVVTPKKPEDHDRPQYTGQQNISLEMTLPDASRAQGLRQCDDILKIFVTSIATSFSAFRLPEIRTSGDALNGVGRDRARFHELSELLSHLSAPVRGPDTGRPDENWTTRSFIVRTIESDVHASEVFTLNCNSAKP